MIKSKVTKYKERTDIEIYAESALSTEDQIRFYALKDPELFDLAIDLSELVEQISRKLPTEFRKDLLTYIIELSSAVNRLEEKDHDRL